MLIKRYSHLSLRQAAVLCAGFALWLGGSSAGFAFLETFDSYAEGESIVGPDWEILNTATLLNTAIVQAGSYVAVTAQGNSNGVNGKASSRLITNYFPRQVTDADFNHIEVDIRRRSPGSRDDSLSLVYLNLYGGADTLNIGFIPDQGLDYFFFDFGGSSNRILSPWYLEIDPVKWYRFVVDITPSTGDFSFNVIDLATSESLWSGTNVSEGLAPFSPAEWKALIMIVARPGSQASEIQSADFDNISIPGPDPVLDTPVGARLAEAVELQFETVDGHYYQIETSTDQQNWEPDGNLLIGRGTPVERYYTAPDQGSLFFRVRTNQ